MDGKELSFRMYQQVLVQWQPNKPNCQYCKYSSCFDSSFLRTKFGLLEGRHHCRVCGNVICTGCSLFLPIRLADDTIQDVRICPTCHSIVFRPPPPSPRLQSSLASMIHGPFKYTTTSFKNFVTKSMTCSISTHPNWPCSMKDLQHMNRLEEIVLT